MRSPDNVWWGWCSPPVTEQLFLDTFSRGSYREMEDLDIAELVKRGFDINCTDKDGNTAMCLSIYGNRPLATKILLEHGADVNKVNNIGDTPLHLILKSRANQCFLELLLPHVTDANRVDSNGATPLHIAMRNNDRFNYVYYILRHGADVNIETNGITPLFEAVSHERVSCVESLLGYGADVNRSATNTTPLHVAVLRGNRRIVQLLLDSPSIQLNALNSHGRTALWLASWSNNRFIAHLLIQMGAKIDIADIHIAETKGYIGMMDFLILERKATIVRTRMPFAQFLHTIKDELTTLPAYTVLQNPDLQRIFRTYIA